MQELVAKAAVLPGHIEGGTITWHMIGHLQRNKAKEVVAHADWLHSLDRLSIAERLARQRPSGMAPLDVCLQVNIDRESTKAGVDPDQLEALALGVVALPSLRLRGLMAIPRPRAVGDQRQPFRELASLLARLRATSPRRMARCWVWTITAIA